MPRLEQKLFERLRSRWPGLAALALLVCAFPHAARGAEADGATPAASRAGASGNEESSTVEPPTLRFSFRYAPWEDVLEWLAEEAELSLSKDVIPAGTFNYMDEHRRFTVAEAMDLINKHLLIKGYTLLRTDKTLLVLDYENEIDKQLIRELLSETPLGELDKRGEYEMTKTTFNLAHMDPAEAEKQVNQLLNPFGSLVVMPQAKRIVATDTGGTLRKIRAIFEDLEETAETESKNKVHVFRLRTANAHEVLTAARPLVQLGEDESAAEDGSIRISADPAGRTVFAAGAPEKVKIVEQLVESIDSAGAGDGLGEQQQFIAHTLKTAQPEAVLRVLQTLLGDDPTVRLEIDSSGGGIMAMAKPSQHRTIQATIAEMEQHSARLEVIPLAVTDPLEAVNLVTSLFATSQTPPAINGTFSPPQLVVRGSEAQIEKIRDLLERMGERFDRSPLAATARGNVRVFQMDPDQARLLVERIEEIWPRISNNPVTVVRPGGRASSIRTMRPDATVIDGTATRPSAAAPEENSPDGSGSGRQTSDSVPVPSADGGGKSEIRRDRTAGFNGSLRTRDLDSMPSVRALAVSEQTITPNQGAPNQGTPDQGTPDDGTPDEGTYDEDGQDAISQPESAQSLADPQNLPPLPTEESSTAPGIVIVPTPSGLMVTSEDEQALTSIESLIEMFADQAGEAGPRYHLFYLRHVAAEEAVQLLTSLLTGTSTSASSTSSTLGFGGPSSVGLVGMAGAPLTTSAPTLIANKRLNSLFVQGTPAQVRLIDQLLQVIDIESGPEEVLTFPKPHFIPVYNTTAQEVVAVLEKLYVHRIETGQNGQRGRGNDDDDRRRDFMRRFGGGRGGDDDRGNEVRQDVAGNLSKMTLAADTSSNSVVVSAPGPLVEEVELVVRDIDGRAAQTPPPTVGVVSLKHANPSYVKDALVNVLGDMAESSQSSTRGRPAGGDRSNRGDPGEFFRRGGFGGFGGFGRGRFGGGDGGDRGGRGGDRGGRGGGDRGGGDRGGRGGR